MLDSIVSSLINDTPIPSSNFLTNVTLAIHSSRVTGQIAGFHQILVSSNITSANSLGESVLIEPSATPSSINSLKSVDPCVSVCSTCLAKTLDFLKES